MQARFAREICTVNMKNTQTNGCLTRSVSSRIRVQGKRRARGFKRKTKDVGSSVTVLTEGNLQQTPRNATAKAANQKDTLETTIPTGWRQINTAYSAGQTVGKGLYAATSENDLSETKLHNASPFYESAELLINK